MLIMGFLAELFVSLVLEIVGEFVLAIGWVTVSSPFRKEREMPFPLAALGIVIIAAFCAWVYDVFVPNAIFSSSPVPGISMVLAPLAVGGLTHLTGKWLKEKGRPSSHLMTYWGGALFAFVLSATRFFLLR